MKNISPFLLLIFTLHFGLPSPLSAFDAAILVPILQSISTGTSAIKNAMKFDEVLNQYDKMTEIQQKSDQSLDTLKNQTNSVLLEAKRFIKNPEEAYKLATDLSYRKNYLISKLAVNENGEVNESLRTVLDKVYSEEKIELKDISNLYAELSEAQEIALMEQINQIDPATVTLKKNKRDLAKSNLRLLTANSAEMAYASEALSIRKRFLLDSLTHTSDEKDRSNLLKEIEEIDLKINQYNRNQFVLNKDLILEKETLNRELKTLQRDAEITEFAKQIKENRKKQTFQPKDELTPVLKMMEALKG